METNSQLIKQTIQHPYYKYKKILRVSSDLEQENRKQKSGSQSKLTLIAAGFGFLYCLLPAQVLIGCLSAFYFSLKNRTRPHKTKMSGDDGCICVKL